MRGRARRHELALGVGRVELADAHNHLRGAALIAARAAELGGLPQIRLGVHEHALPGRQVGQAKHRVLVVADLENLLVERRRLREEALVEQMIRDGGEPGDRVIGMAGTNVEIAEGVHRAPVVRLIRDELDVLRDGSVELSLAKQFLRPSQRLVAINRHFINS